MTASRSVARRLVAAACVASGLPALLHAQQQPSIVERADVTRVLIDARVVNAGGQPVLELGTDDFDVEIGGEPAPVESVVWVSGRTGRSEAELTASPVVRSDFLRQGRLVVLLFQKDMERGRIRGLMRILVELRGFLDTFRPDDRVAVLSFDTYLKIWRDFTNDFDGVRDVLEHGILFRSPGPVREASAPSLLAHLDPARARHTYSIEKTFRLIGNALEPLAGSKSIVLVGHGFGFLTYGGVIMVNQYDEISGRCRQRAPRSFRWTSPTPTSTRWNWDCKPSRTRPAGLRPDERLHGAAAPAARRRAGRPLRAVCGKTARWTRASTGFTLRSLGRRGECSRG